jgi:hypothetical protein
MPTGDMEIRRLEALIMLHQPTRLRRRLWVLILFMLCSMFTSLITSDAPVFDGEHKLVHSTVLLHATSWAHQIHSKWFRIWHKIALLFEKLLLKLYDQFIHVLFVLFLISTVYKKLKHLLLMPLKFTSSFVDTLPLWQVK